MTRLRTRSILSLDYRSMALFRVSMGGVILGDLVRRSCDIQAFYTDYGVLPRAAVLRDHWYSGYLSVYMMSGEGAVVAALFVIAGLAAIALILGYRTKLANLISLGFLLSLHNRNEIILEGGDHLLRLLLFWSLFLPLGARYSIDSVSRPKPVGDTFVSVVSLGVLLQIAFMYVFSAIQKLFDPLWLDGTVIARALLLDDFATPFGVHLLGADTVLRMLAWLTLTMEIMLPVLLFSPVWNGPIRMGAVLAFCLMHIGIHFVLHVGIFTPVTLMAWTIVLPGVFWDTVRSWMRRGDPARVPATGTAASAPVTIATVGLLSAFLVVNVSHIPNHNFVLPRPMTVLMKAPGLLQNWSMFTGLDGYQRGWFKIPALLADGTEIDLFRSASPLSWERPSRPFQWISDTRWYKYYVRMKSPRYESIRPDLGRYLCDRWNRGHDGDSRLEALVVAFVAQEALPSERLDPANSHVLVKQRCSPGDVETYRAWLEKTGRKVLDPASSD